MKVLGVWQMPRRFHSPVIGLGACPLAGPFDGEGAAVCSTSHLRIHSSTVLEIKALAEGHRQQQEDHCDGHGADGGVGSAGVVPLHGLISWPELKTASSESLVFGSVRVICHACSQVTPPSRA